MLHLLDQQRKALFDIHEAIQEQQRKQNDGDIIPETSSIGKIETVVPRRDSVLTADASMDDISSIQESAGSISAEEKELQMRRTKILLGLEKEKKEKRDLGARKGSEPRIALGVHGEETWESTTYYV